MTRLPLVAIAAITLTATLTAPEPAEACSFAGNQEFFVDSDEEALDTQAPDRPVVVSTEIHRFDSDAGCGGASSCDGIVTLTIEIAAGDDRTSADLMGFSLRVVDGDLPVDLPAMPVSSGAGGEANGNARLLFFWDSDDAESGTLEITPIDLAGNAGPPVEIEISDPGVGGCRSGGRGGLFGAFALLGALAAFRPRRREIEPGGRRQLGRW